MYTEKVLHFFNLVANIFSSQLCKKGISVHVLQYSTVLVPVFFSYGDKKTLQLSGVHEVGPTF